MIRFICAPKYGYLFKVDNELKIIVAENISIATQIVELSYPDKTWTLEYSASIPILE